MRVLVLPLLLLASTGCEIVLGIETRVVATCRGGTARCDDDGRRLVCEPDGSAEVEEPCEGSLVCEGAGQCVLEQACEPNALRCDEAGRRLLCADDGASETELPCDGGEVCLGAGECSCDPGSAILARGAGRDHVCAIACGRLACWGRNDSKQLGIEPVESTVPEPTHVPLPKPPVEVVTGFAHTCARLVDGDVYCWGENEHGEVLGTSSLPIIYTPTRVPELSGARAIGAGMAITCAILTTGEIRCVGRNGKGRLGDAGTLDSRTPLTVTPPAGVTTAALRIDVGTEHVCATFEGGTLVCWGNQRLIGVGLTSDAPGPPAVVDLDDVSELSVGDLHTCVIAGGTVYCFGGSDRGQCGRYSDPAQPEPVALPGPGAAVQVRAGFRSTCASTGAALYCWGSNESGQLGDGLCEDATDGCSGLTTASPVLASSEPIHSLGVYWTHACAARPDGLFCWGANAWSQSGSGSEATYLGEPTPVLWPPRD